MPKTYKFLCRPIYGKVHQVSTVQYTLYWHPSLSFLSKKIHINHDYPDVSPAAAARTQV